MFKLSSRSLSRLEGVDDRLVRITKRAIELTTIDFGVTQGMRTLAQQKEYFEKGATKTMKSKHLEGKAVDVVAYIGSRVSWELNLYDNIADAFKQAAIEEDVQVRWGAAWTVHDIRKWEGTMEEAMMSYVDARRAQGRRPFIDSPHFELMD